MPERESFEARFARYLPGLDDITGLDLNQNHFLTVEDPGTSPNLGVGGLYAIGNTGHHYLVSCVLPGVAPERYPIALFGEEEGVATVIAASIATWFPSFLIYRLNELLAHHWLCQARGSAASASTNESLDGILAKRDAITRICKGFGNPAFLAALDGVLATVEKRDQSAWDYHALYRLAEGDSPLGRFYELKQKKAAEADYAALVRACPDYNYVLFHRFLSVDDDRPSRRIVDVHRAPPPPEVAVEVFSRRLSLDFGNTTDMLKVLTMAAKSCQGTIDESSPYFAIVETIAEVEGRYNDLELAEPFRDLGDRLKEAQLGRAAATAYENAVFFAAVESGELDALALEGLTEVASTLGDEEYEAYLASYRQRVAGDDT